MVFVASCGLLFFLFVTVDNAELYYPSYDLRSHEFRVSQPSAWMSGRVQRLPDDEFNDELMVRQVRNQLSQLNRLLKKPIFNFANLFRRPF
ncbi:hypothetical protein AB6A40_002419 [Gnathostoma spinigerum]|uniref:Uncharacterized protein n=1 Tax=Gnathostoma spinigerum TaxID=75299 RepID=A0ABD6E6I4_9BILA